MHARWQIYIKYQNKGNDMRFDWRNTHLAMNLIRFKDPEVFLHTAKYI